MLMNGKIVFDRYYCINSAEMKEIMVHYIIQPHHIFIRIKAFDFMLVPGGLQFLIINTCFAWHPVTSISRSQIAILMHGFLFINKRLLISCDTGIYAIIKVKTHLQFY